MIVAGGDSPATNGRQWTRISALSQFLITEDTDTVHTQSQPPGRFHHVARCYSGPLAVVVIFALVFGLGTAPVRSGTGDLPQATNAWYQSGRGWLADAQTRKKARSRARNLILFIGDGMSATTVTAARIYAGQQAGGSGEGNLLSFETFPYLALAKTYSVDMQTPDSAATATALLAGVKTRSGVIGLTDAARRGDCASAKGAMARSLLELAEAAGMATGIVTNTPVTHATPAAAYAHVPERGWVADAKIPAAARADGCIDIARQLFEFAYGDGIEVVLGGGRSRFLPAPAGLRADGRDLTRAWLDRFTGGRVITTASELAGLDVGTARHVLGLFAPAGMAFEADRRRQAPDQPSLSAMTAKAIELLSRQRKGFFLLVEGGEIDWAHHQGNAARALIETVEFARAVEVALKQTREKDTLIVVTADHAHTLTMAGYAARGNPILGLVATRNADGEPVPARALDGRPYPTLGYANGPGAVIGADGGARPGDVSDPQALDFRQPAAVPLEFETHSGDDVPVYARGPMADRLRGVIEQNVVFHVMAAAARLIP